MKHQPFRNIVRQGFSSLFHICAKELKSVFKDQGVLITGLINPQVIRTANMMDMICIVFVRGKKPTEEMVELAEECGIAVMTSSHRAYEACGILWSNGLSTETGDR